MSNFALEEWLNEDAFGNPDSGPAQNFDLSNQGLQNQATDNVANANNLNNNNFTNNNIEKSYSNVSNDPVAPDMPEEVTDKDFEDWKAFYFKETNKNDVGLLIDLINQVRNLDLDSYPRKFVEDNLQICFLRQNSNIDKACQQIRKLIRDSLDQNNPSVSLVNHIINVLQTMPELNKTFIKIKGLMGMKGDIHRKFISALLGSVQVGTGGNNEDVIYNERVFSIKISTRFNDKWGRVDLGKWSLKEDDPSRYLTEPEMKRLEEGSPEEKDVLRRRIVLESISDTFKQRAFIVNVVEKDGTIHTLGWDISGCLRGAYTEGRLVVKTIQSENSDAMIDNDGKIIPYVDIKIKYIKDTGELDQDGKPVKEEFDFMEKIDGVLFLTCDLNTLKEVSTSFSGIALKETPYVGNPSELQTIQRCIPSCSEIISRNC